MKEVEVNKMDNENIIFEQYAELVRRWKSGDEAAFNEIYGKSQKLVYTTCLGILGNEQDAEEATQDTYLKAYESIGTLSDEKSFIPWLKRIAANKALDKCKYNKNDISYEDISASEETLEGEDLEYLPEALVIEKDKRDTFHKIIRDSLSDDQYRTTLLYYYDEMPVADIAKVMNCPENTVKTKLRLSRAKIKAGIEAFESANKISLMGAAAGTQTLGKFFSEFYGSARIPALKALPLEAAGSKGAAAGAKIAAKATGKAASAGAKGSFISSPLAKIGIGVAAIAVLAVPAVFAIRNLTDDRGNSTKKSKKGSVEIDLNDYFSYEFSGYDGEGAVSYSIDYEGIIDDCESLDELKPSKLEKKISGEWDRSSDLNNGEIIVFKWDTDLESIEEEYNVIFVCENIEATVKDLEELTEIDPFEGFSISFAGLSSEGYVDDYTRSNNTPIGDIYYAFSSDNGLSNGDVITVTATCLSMDIDDMARDAHYRLSRKTMEVTVDGLDEYVKSSSELTDDFVEQLQARAFEVYKSDHVWARYNSLEAVGTYFLYSNSATEHKNIYYVVLRATREFTSPDYAEVEQYYYVCFYDLMRHYDGTMFEANLYSHDRSYGTEIYYNEPMGKVFEAEGHDVIGYPDLDSLYADAIRPLLTDYSCEST